MKAALTCAIIAGAVQSTVGLDRFLYGLDYDTRANQWGGCKSEWAVRADFNAMKTVTNNVRIYSAQEPCVERVLNIAAEHKMKVWLGLWGNIEPELDAFERDFNVLQRLVKQKKVRNDNVLGVGVSSEAIYRHYIQGGHDFSETDGTEKLLKYVARTRDFIRSNGLNFPVTISDVMDAYKYSANLYDGVDVVSANQFSQWETIPVEDAVNTLFERLIPIRAQAVKRGKPIMIMETGWSQAGSNPSILAASPESAAQYLKEYLAFAEEQNLQYYYFTSFNLAFGGDTDFGLIEKNFGVFDEHRKIHPLLDAVEVGAAPIAVRLWHNGKVIKVNGANTRTPGRVYVGEPNYGLTGHLDEEIWFYYPQKSMFKSKSWNQCLDTYVDGDGNDVLHVYKCDESNANQKWAFVSDGNNEIMSEPFEDLPTPAPTKHSVFRPTTKAPTTKAPAPKPQVTRIRRVRHKLPAKPKPVAPVSSTDKWADKCGDCVDNCQFVGAGYTLCYNGWDQNVCKLMGSTHHWCGHDAPVAPAPVEEEEEYYYEEVVEVVTDAPTPAPKKTTQTPAPTFAQVIETRRPDFEVEPVVITADTGMIMSHSPRGKCLAINDGTTIAMSECHFEASTTFSIRALAGEEIQLSVAGSEWKLTEYYGRVRMSTDPIAESHPDTQIWFFNTISQTIRNKANGAACLELVEDKVGGLVEGRLCDDSNIMQKWVYNDKTGQIIHHLKLAQCLSADGASKEVRAQFCDTSAVYQKWFIELTHATTKHDPAQLPWQTPFPTAAPGFHYAPTPAPTKPRGTTHAPTTAAPTEAPATEAPTTAAPTTEAPTTAAPTTEAPTTAAPTTEAPTTAAPVVTESATFAPTTEAPTTAAPTTAAPTTAAPTTAAPTTAAPTTAAPTTAAPTTAAPTTEAPTTETPKTAAPVVTESATFAPTPAPTTANCHKYTIQLGDSSWKILHNYCAKFDGRCTKDASKPHIQSSVDGSYAVDTVQLCPSYLRVDAEIEICCGDYIYEVPPPTAAPTTEAPTTAAPTTEAPTTAAPATTAAPVATESATFVPTEAATTAAPTTAAATTPAPEDDFEIPTPAPTKAAEFTAAPTTSAPTTAAPKTEAPVATESATFAPATEAATTAAPTTAAPTTEAPTTAAPTTAAPTTEAPTTAAPTTAAPKTEAPVVTESATLAPTTEAATTAAPTTEAPTTAAPTTVAPTTVAPTTAAPATTAAPVATESATFAPTTEAATTAAPTTAAPTTTAAPATTAAPVTTAPAPTTDGSDDDDYEPPTPAPTKHSA